MKSDILVSIIIPVYNVSSFLVESLDSVLQQTYSNLEVIIVDDGSSDGSAEICEKYAKRDHRIRLIHQSNQGLSSARNRGLDIMTGDVVAFLDSDDAYTPSFIYAMISVMHKEQADIVTCRALKRYTKSRMRIFDHDLMNQSHSIKVLNRNEALRALSDGLISHGVWNKLYKRHLWENIRFPVGHVFEDLDTTFRILAHSDKICILEQQLYLYRQHSTSITKTFSQHNISDRILAEEHFLSFIRSSTPAVYTEEDVNKRLLHRFRMMIYLYGKYILKAEDDPEFEAKLRRKILKLGKEIGIHSAGFPMKIRYYLICYCPQVVKLAYHTIYPIRNWIRRLG